MLEGYLAQRRLRRLIHDWRQLRDVVAEARGLEVTMDQEERFRELQARIATRLRSVADVVPFVAADEARREFGAMTDFLKQQLSLRDASQGGDPDAFERFWHGHYIFLNQLKGVPLGRQEESRGPRRRASAIPGGTERRWRRMNRFPFARLMRLVLTIAVLAIAIHFTVFGLGVRYDSSADQFVVANQVGVGKVVQSVLNTLLDLGMDVVKFFDPLVLAYGPTWTALLFIILAFSLAYWMFVRG